MDSTAEIERLPSPLKRNMSPKDIDNSNENDEKVVMNALVI